jgi:sugar phosphate isomerase/epimerase
LKIGCQILQWGNAIDHERRSTWDGRVWNRNLASVLDDIARLGYDGFDCSENDLALYFSNPTGLARLVGDRGLEFGSAWVTLIPKKMRSGEIPRVDQSLPMSDPRQFLPVSIRAIDEESANADFREKVRYAELISEIGGDVIILGGPFIDPRLVKDSDYSIIGSLLNEIGEEIKKFGVKIAYHHHLCTPVQNMKDLDKLFEFADPNLVGLCLDSAHLRAVGDDPVEFVKKYSSRIKHVHLKDLSKEGKFVELGRGEVDLEGIIDELKKVGYDRWLVAELDIPSSSAIESARVNKNFFERIM